MPNELQCRKCGKTINPDDGYWEWEQSKAVKGGYYHTSCGVIGESDFTKKFIDEVNRRTVIR